MDQGPDGIGLIGLIQKIDPETWAQGSWSLFAVTVRILLAPARSVRQSLGGAGAGLMCAFLLTDPVAQTLRMEESSTIVAASIALIGEQLVRRYIEAAESPTFYRAILRRMGFRVGVPTGEASENDEEAKK